MEDQVKNKSELLNDLKIDRRQAPGKNRLSITQGALIALLSLGAGFLVALYLPALSDLKPVQQGAEQAQKAPDAKVVEVSKPAEPQALNASVAEKASASKTERTSFAILNASGYITARRMATVSAEIMGLITEVNVEEGMQVTEGQVLARLDDALARVDIETSKAQLDVRKAQKQSIQVILTEAEINHERVVENHYSSEAERTRVQSELSQMKASLVRANADIRVAELDIKRNRERYNDHIIRAPFAGIVTVKAAQPGEIVAPTSAGGGFTRTGICTIVDMDSLEIEVDVNESFIGRVFAGQKVEAQLDAYPDWNIPASVIAIIPKADRAKATVRVRINIDIKDPKILPDMGVKVAFFSS